MTTMIDYLRIASYASLVLIVFVLFQTWQKEHPPVVTTSASSAQVTSAANNYIPQVTNTASSTSTTSAVPATTATQTVATSPHVIHVTTDVLNVDIDAVGGNIVGTQLLKYPQELHSTTPVTLLTNSPQDRYIAQSGLLSSMGPDTSKGQALYSYEKNDYQLDANQNDLIIKLSWQSPQGLKINKFFTFKRNNYEVDVTYEIENQSPQVFQGNTYLQLMRKNNPPPNTQGFMNLATYFGAAVSSPEKPFQKISFKEMSENNLNQTIHGGWAAMVQHYFISAWVPDKNATSQYFSRITNDGLYTIGMLGPSITVNPGQKMDTYAKFYAGPSSAEKLQKVAPGLELTIDYGWFWLISSAIFWMMQKIYNVVGNWGWAIVIVTVIIKLLFFHLSAKSYRSMSMLKKLQPRINMLKERYADDKQKFTQATLELYKKEKVNPMSGCLPILIQIPVFIALYWVLIESVELRQAPFILWIHDLSTKDPFYILPVLMGLSFFLQQRLNPPMADPMQAKLMQFMPIIFTVLFLNFPAGLMLYWFVNNTLSFVQQWYIMRSLDRAEKAKKK